MASREGPVEVSRLVYNEQAGAETPEQPELPACAEHVWTWWWELNNRRPPGFDSIAPLSYGEIKSWLMLTGRYIAPEEIDWLISLDNAWLSTIATERRDKADRDREKENRKQQGRK